MTNESGIHIPHGRTAMFQADNDGETIFTASLVIDADDEAWLEVTIWPMSGSPNGQANVTRVKYADLLYGT